MSRPVPEAAPLVGLVLAFGFALFGVLFSTDHLSTALGTVVLLYPFVGFGLARSDDPTAAVRPDPVLAVGFLAGAGMLLYGITDGRPLYGALVAAVVAVPPCLYHARFGDSVNPLSPRASLGVGLLAAAGILTYAVVVDRLLLGAVTAGIAGLAAVAYRRERGGPLARRERTLGVLAGLGGGLVAFVTLTVAGRSAAGLAVGGVLVALGTAVALATEHP